MTFPLGRLMTLNACLCAGHLAAPVLAGLAVWLSTIGSRLPTCFHMFSRACDDCSSSSSMVVLLLLVWKMLRGCR